MEIPIEETQASAPAADQEEQPDIDSMLNEIEKLSPEDAQRLLADES